MRATSGAAHQHGWQRPRPSGTETVLNTFGSGSDGAGPQAGLINVKGTLYGTTQAGGANGDGTVFSLAL